MAPETTTLALISAPTNVWSRVGQLIRRRETVFFLAVAQLKTGHRDKLLGNLWNILDPLLMMLVYFLVFGIILKVGSNDPVAFLAYLFVGVLVWRFVETCIGQSAILIRSHRDLIHEINFPKAVLPLAVCFARLYDLLWGLAVLAALLGVASLASPTVRLNLSPHLLWLPLLFALLFSFVAGASFLVAWLGAFFVDTPNVAGVIVRLWFYASPICYYVSGPHGQLPDWIRGWYMLNPMAGFLEDIRNIALSGAAPGHLPYLAAVSAVSALVGFSIFARGEGAFVKYV